MVPRPTLFVSFEWLEYLFTIATSKLFYCVVLTMEMNGVNERGYKIEGPHWNALHCYSNGDL